MTVEQILLAIDRLPIRERLRLVERVVHDLADTSLPDQREPEDGDAMLGLFADDPASVDDMMVTVMEMRRGSRLRVVEGDDAKGAP
jgi:hypothetical protein